MKKCEFLHVWDEIKLSLEILRMDTPTSHTFFLETSVCGEISTNTNIPPLYRYIITTHENATTKWNIYGDR